MAQLMDKSLQHSNALQNISAIDRMVRILIGSAMIGVWFVPFGGTVAMWQSLVALAGILPLLSGIMGWCPVYALFGTRGCGVDAHNTCGTLPFQISRLIR